MPVVLTIDDEKPIRDSIRNFLEDYDYTVIDAENGREGLALFQREKPDVILVDLIMPEIGGLEVLAKVREDSPDTPVIVVSGTGAISDVVQALRLGAWDYLFKPVQDMTVLLHSVETVYERSRLIAENRQYREHLESEVAKRTEELKRLNDDLKKEIALREESENKYRGYIENAPDGVFITDEKGRCLEVNRAASTITGYSSEELLGMSIIDLLPREAREDGFKRFEQFRERGKGYGEMLFQRRGREGVFVHVDAVKLSENRFMAFCKDITKRKKAEKETRELHARLNQARKMESIGTLAGGIAHDFNNILTAILGYAELTMDDLPQASPAQKNLRAVLQAGERAKNLVQQILSFSRISEEASVPVAPHIVLKEVLKLLRSSLPSTIEIRKSVESSEYILADATQIHQILMNLCTNAYHAMSDGGVLGVSLEKVNLDGNEASRYPNLLPGPHIKLEVSDTGHGMAPDVVQRIFEPYYTTKDPGKGTGLGLSVVHGIVKSHNGAINVESVPGKGTVFTLYFPVIRHSVTRAPEGGSIMPCGTERILLVDDEEQIVMMMEQMLQRLGYSVVACTDSFTALDFFREKPGTFDVVISDMTMPGMTGIKLASNLMHIRSDIPIIICTGFSEQISEEKAAGVGIRKLVMKPVSMRDIAKSIREVLD